MRRSSGSLRIGADTPSISIGDFVRSRARPWRPSRIVGTDSRERRRSVLPPLPRPAVSLLPDSDFAPRAERTRGADGHARDPRRQPGCHLFRLLMADTGTGGIPGRDAIPCEPHRHLVHRTRASSAVRAVFARVSGSAQPSAIATGRRAVLVRSRRRRGLAFCTLEIAFVLILTMAICFRGDLRFAGKSVATVSRDGTGHLASCDRAIVVREILRGDGVSRTDARSAVGQCGIHRHVARTHLRFTAGMDTDCTCCFVVGFRSRRFYAIGIFVGLMLLATLRVLTTTPRYSLTFLPMLDLARWPHAAPIPRDFAEASQLCHRCAGCCRVRIRLDSGGPQTSQYQSPFDGGSDIYTPKRPGEQDTSGTTSRFGDAALLLSSHAAAWLFRRRSQRPGSRGLHFGCDAAFGYKTLTPSRPATIACVTIPRKSPCSTTPTMLFSS